MCGSSFRSETGCVFYLTAPDSEADELVTFFFLFGYTVAHLRRGLVLWK